MPQITIPQQWRTQVCAILETEATGKLIEWTDDATKRFEASFLEAWPYELYAALKVYFTASNPTGCFKTMAAPVGEAYEFFFTFKEQKTYGKVLLREDGKRIVVFSAHHPLKDTLDCE
jgi:hypothetical protein